MQDDDGSLTRIQLDRFESTSITTSGSKVKIICPGLRVQIYEKANLQSKIVSYVLDGREVYVESAQGIFFKLSRNKGYINRNTQGVTFICEDNDMKLLQFTSTSKALAVANKSNFEFEWNLAADSNAGVDASDILQSNQAKL